MPPDIDTAADKTSDQTSATESKPQTAAEKRAAKAAEKAAAKAAAEQQKTSEQTGEQKDEQAPAASPSSKAAPTTAHAKRLRVQSRNPRGFWRAGIRFTPEPQEIDVASLSEAQLAALNAEPELIVESI